MAHLFFFALLALSSSSSSLPSIFAAHTAGLHLRLTQVDSGQPFSSTGRMNRLVQRSHHRRKVLESRLRNSLPASFDVPVKASMFDYFIEYSIGTPKLPVTGVLDTGSEVVWAKCRPCEQCDEEGISIYDPSKSSTFSKLPCSSPLYDYQPLKPFSVPKCQYVYVYGSAIINGFLATDAFSLGAESATANLTFGCNKLVKGTFSGATGVVGLGQGKLSLVSQLNLGRFSYCLTPFKSSSKSHLLLGDLARSTKRASSGEVQSTPLLNATDQYYVAMQGISIGGNRLPIPASTFEYSKEESSGAIFDSGTGQTQLPQLAFDAIKKELQSLVGLPVKDMSKTVGLDLCFRLSSWPPPPLPDMVFHFDNGADMRMPQMNYMFADQRTRAYCLVMRPGQNGDKLTIIGNYQQQNMHVIYDITSRMLLFESTSCESF